MAFNARNIFLSETAPVIYDGNKTPDYYWTNFPNRKKSDVLTFRSFSTEQKAWVFRSLVPEDKQIKLYRAHLANMIAPY